MADQGRVGWALRLPVLVAALVSLLSSPVSPQTLLISHFEPASDPAADFFNGEQWLYQSALQPVDGPPGDIDGYGDLHTDPYEVLTYFGGWPMQPLRLRGGALGSARGLSWNVGVGGGPPGPGEPLPPSTGRHLVFQFARVDHKGNNSLDNLLTFLDDEVVVENTDSRIRDWSNYTWLSFFLRVDAVDLELLGEGIAGLIVQVQEYRQGRVDAQGNVVDLERAVYEVSLGDVAAAGYGPTTGALYTGWQHWLVPLPGGPVTWTSVATNPDGTPTYDYDHAFTKNYVRALIFTRPGDALFRADPAFIVIDGIVLTNRCDCRIARIDPGRGANNKWGLSFRASPESSVDVTLRASNPLAALTTFAAKLEGEALVSSPQYQSEIAIGIWPQSPQDPVVTDCVQPRTLRDRLPTGLASRRGNAIHPSNPDWKYLYLTDRREFDQGHRLTTTDPLYLAGHFDARGQVALTLFVLPKGEDAAGNITVGQGECVDVLILPQPKTDGRLWRRYVFGTK